MNKSKGITQFPANSPIGQKIQLLQHDLLQLSVRPCFPTVVSQAFGNVMRSKEGVSSRKSRFNSEYLSSLFSSLRLNPTQRVMIATGIAKCEDETFASAAITYLKSEIPSLSSSGGGSLPNAVLESLLSMIRLHPSFVMDPVVAKKCYAALLKAHPEMAKLRSGEVGFTEENLKFAPILFDEVASSRDDLRVVNNLSDNVRDDEVAYADLASDILASTDVSNMIKSIGYACTWCSSV